MSQTQDTDSQRVKSMQEANAERHYIILVVAIIIGLVGVFLRFADFKHASAVANVIMAVGAGIALKSIFNILG